MHSAQKEVLQAEQNVTNTLNTHGKDSEEYKKALNIFASKWQTLVKREEALNAILND